MAEISVGDPPFEFPAAGRRRPTLVIPPPPPEDGPEDPQPPLDGPNLVTFAIMSYGVHISTSRSSSFSSPVDELSPVLSFSNLSESGQSGQTSESSTRSGSFTGQNQGGVDGSSECDMSDEERDTLGAGGSPPGGRRLPSLNSSSPSLKRSSNLNPSPTGSPCISPVPSTTSLHGDAAAGVCGADAGAGANGVSRRHGGGAAAGSKRLSALNPNSGSVNGIADSPSTSELSSPESGSPVQSPGATTPTTPTSPMSVPGSPKPPLNHVTVNLWKNQPGVGAVIGSMEKHEIQRQELMQEIIVSESSYVKDLETTKRLFHFPLNKFKVITSEESADIFGDINKLIKINSELLQDLKQRQKDQWPILDDVSDILLPFFRNIYTNYHKQCENIRSSSAKVVDLMKTNAGFASFMSTLTKNEGVDVLGLNSYLIKPLQRVTKYALLMRELKKFTPETHHSYTCVCECLDTVEKAVGAINEFTRSSEQQTQLFELQQKLDMSDLPAPITIPQQGRILLKEGPIKVELYSSGGKDSGRKEFHGFLFNDMLLLTKKRKRTAADDKKMTKLLQAGRRGSSSDIGTPPTSPVLGSGVIYKVMTEPLYLMAAERHSQDTKVVFEFFSSYAMTMYVVEVPLVPSPADDPHQNETWCPELIRAINTQKGPEAVPSEEKNEGADSGEGSANKPKVNMVQANLWKNQPGAREIAGTLEKNEVQRQECMQELYLSEVAYVKDLNSTIVLFYRPLQKFQILPSYVVEDVFGDIPKLHRHNKKFLEDLEEKRREQWPLYTDVSDVLLPFFGCIYDNYCNHCQKTKACSEKVVDLLESNKMFADFMSTLTKNEGVDVLGLNSYLIKPLQRITKYNLLLRELLRYTPPDHPSFAGVTKAYELVGKALTDINEYQRQSEYKEQLFDIQSHLEALPDGDPVVVYSPGRHVLAQGPCHVEVMVKRKVKKTVKEGYCFVFNDAILFAKRKPAKDTSSKRKRMSMGTSLKRQSNSVGNSQEHQGYTYKVIGQVFLHKDATVTTLEKGIVYEYPEAAAPTNTYGIRIIPGDEDLPNNTLGDTVARAIADAKQPKAQNLQKLSGELA